MFALGSNLVLFFTNSTSQHLFFLTSLFQKVITLCPHIALVQHIQTNWQRSPEVVQRGCNQQAPHIRPLCFEKHQPVFLNPACSTAKRCNMLTPSPATLNLLPRLHSYWLRIGGGKTNSWYSVCLHLLKKPLILTGSSFLGEQWGSAFCLAPFSLIQPCCRWSMNKWLMIPWAAYKLCRSSSSSKITSYWSKLGFCFFALCISSKCS